MKGSESGKSDHRNHGERSRGLEFVGVSLFEYLLLTTLPGSFLRKPRVWSHGNGKREARNFDESAKLAKVPEALGWDEVRRDEKVRRDGREGRKREGLLR